MKPDEFRRLGHELIEWIATYRERVADLPVRSPVRPGDVRAQLPSAPPERGGGLADVIASIDRTIVPGITHWNHPRFFAYFPANTTLSSVLADLLCAGLGAQGMSWQTSPAATEVEEVVMDWLRQMLGLSSAWTGVIHDTASTATLVALLCARERTTGFAQQRGGLQDGGAPLCVYTSAEAHSSVAKAALLAGFGKEHVRAIETDDATLAMRVDRLEEAILADLRAGLRPCAIVATVGTTATTAIDPVAACAAIAAHHGAWLHVDVALAGSAMILPECRPLWDGVEYADSMVTNPHKWLGAGFDLSAYFVRDVQHLIRVMGTNPSYLRTAEDGAVSNFRDWHIQLGRRFRALKLWFLIVDEGVEGLQARLRRDLDNTRWLAERVEAAPDWELVTPAPLQTVCLRHRTADNLALAERIAASGFAHLTPTVVRGQPLLRVSVGAEPTTRDDVAALWERLQVEARSAGPRPGDPGEV